MLAWDFRETVRETIDQAERPLELDKADVGYKQDIEL